jgi:dTMP kinase
MSNQNPKFIAFVGIDGTGKSTIIKGLFRHMHNKEMSVVALRDPGGTEFGLELRELLFKCPDLTEYTKLLLFRAMREELVEKAIKPQLAQGNHVLCDRYSPCTYVYQGILGGLLEEVKQLDEGCLVPDKIVLLDLDPAISIERLNQRLEQANYYDGISLEKKTIMREAYLDLARKDPDRWCIVDASRDPAGVMVSVIFALADTLDLALS